MLKTLFLLNENKVSAENHQFCLVKAMVLHHAGAQTLFLLNENKVSDENHQFCLVKPMVYAQP